MSGSDPGTYQVASLGATPGSTVWILLKDSDRTQGNRSLDQVFVDHMFIRTQSTNDPPPGKPVASASSVGTTEIDLSWTNVSGELGYTVERAESSGGPYSDVGSVGTDVTAFTDTGLSPATTYYYQIVAFNGGGSTASDEVSATTDDPPAQPELHLGDLTATTSGKNRWKMDVFPVVHNSSHNPEAGALVSGTYSTGGSGSCTTDGAGTCKISQKPTSGNGLCIVYGDRYLSSGDPIYDAGANDVSPTVNASAPDALAKADGITDIPEAFTLNQNYPNPFNPVTVLEYGLPAEGHVTVSIYNTLGGEIARLEDGVASAGWHRVTFDGAGPEYGAVSGRGSERGHYPYEVDVARQVAGFSTID